MIAKLVFRCIFGILESRLAVFGRVAIGVTHPVLRIQV